MTEEERNAAINLGVNHMDEIEALGIDVDSFNIDQLISINSGFEQGLEPSSIAGVSNPDLSSFRLDLAIDGVSRGDTPEQMELYNNPDLNYWQAYEGKAMVESDSVPDSTAREMVRPEVSATEMREERESHNMFNISTPESGIIEAFERVGIQPDEYRYDALVEMGHAVTDDHVDDSQLSIIASGGSTGDRVDTLREGFSSLSNDQMKVVANSDYNAPKMEALINAFHDGLSNDQVLLCAEGYSLHEVNAIKGGIESGLTNEQIGVVARSDLGTDRIEALIDGMQRGLPVERAEEIADKYASPDYHPRTDLDAMKNEISDALSEIDVDSDRVDSNHFVEITDNTYEDGTREFTVTIDGQDMYTERVDESTNADFYAERLVTICDEHPDAISDLVERGETFDSREDFESAVSERIELEDYDHADAVEYINEHAEEFGIGSDIETWPTLQEYNAMIDEVENSGVLNDVDLQKPATADGENTGNDEKQNDTDAEKNGNEIPAYIKAEIHAEAEKYRDEAINNERESHNPDLTPLQRVDHSDANQHVTPTAIALENLENTGTGEEYGVSLSYDSSNQSEPWKVTEKIYNENGDVEKTRSKSFESLDSAASFFNVEMSYVTDLDCFYGDKYDMETGERIEYSERDQEDEESRKVEISMEDLVDLGEELKSSIASAIDEKIDEFKDKIEDTNADEEQDVDSDQDPDSETVDDETDEADVGEQDNIEDDDDDWDSGDSVD